MPRHTGGEPATTVASPALLYIDGALASSGTLTSLPSGGEVVLFNNSTNATADLAHLAVYLNTTPSAARVAALASGGLNGGAGESAGARITRLAAYAPALPVGTIEAGSAVAFVDFTGRSQADEMRNVAATDVGLLDIDGDGGLDYTSRATIAGKATPDLTLPASWLERDLQPVVDNQQIVNFFDASNAAGTVARVRNEASETTHGRYADSKQYLLDDIDDARARRVACR